MFKITDEHGKEISCYSSQEAEAVIAKNSGREKLAKGYLNQLVRLGRLKPIKLNSRVNGYPIAQVDKIRVRDFSQGRAGIVGRKKQDNPSQGALRKRKHDADRRRERYEGQAGDSLCNK